MLEMDDAALLAAFEAGVIRPADFGHREHLRIAFAIVAREPDLAAAAARFRAVLRGFAGAKYHETLTWAYLALIAERTHVGGFATSAALLAAHPDLLDHRGGAIARYYDVAAVTASPVARAVFVLPRPR